MDQAGCHKHICTNCFLREKDQQCECGRINAHHYIRDGKVKPSLKLYKMEECSKNFNREYKLRKNQFVQTLTVDLINLLAYLQQNPAPQRKLSYIALQDELKRVYRERKKEEKTMNKELSTRKKAVYITRISNNQENGLESCGYQRSYYKGIELVRNAFK